MYKVVDLFSGAGGLSLGFLQSKKFEIKIAFENNPSMQQTYHLNHPDVDLRGDVCAADYNSIKAQYGEIDVVIGGPPCQGFSNANRQKNHAVSQNNMLVKQYIRAVRELKPKAFVMENVSMLCSDKHRFFYNKNDVRDVQIYNIKTNNSQLILLDKEYMFSGVREAIQQWEIIKDELWSDDLYCAMNVIYKSSEKNKKTEKALIKHRQILEKEIQMFEKRQPVHKYIHSESLNAFNAIRDYYSTKVKERILKHRIETAIMFQRMLGKAKEIHDNQIIVDSYEDDNGLIANIRTYSVFDYLKSILESGENGYTIDAKVLCAADFGAPQKRERFVVMGVRKKLGKMVKLPEGGFSPKNYRTVKDAIGDLESVNTVTNLGDDTGTRLRKMSKISTLGKELRDTKILYNHIITDTGANAMARFKALKQGENFHSLDESLKTNTYEDVSRTQNTIYLRLDYNQPCGTVVNVRKSMWVHPTLDRAISVREAARLQTFPDSFRFCGTKDKQYQQVGNAVPPILARAIADQLANVLEEK